MPALIAMLRGVNVGGKVIKMASLRETFEDLGFSAVRTYVQSGNVIFVSAEDDPASLSRRIEDRILRKFGHSLPVFLKTSREMGDIVSANPFVEENGFDPSKLHVTFLSKAPPQNASEILEALTAKSERSHILNREIYLYCPEGYGRTKLSNLAMERKLSVVATTRNWRTVNALLEMSLS